MALPIMHVMVDLEALGNMPQNGCLIAIGAQAFVMDEAVVYPQEACFTVCASQPMQFFFPIDIESQVKEYGFLIEGDTLQWWLHPDRSSQLDEFVGSKYKVTLREAFEKFAWWIESLCEDQAQLRLWSHGVTYDCVHLEQKWPIVMKQSFNKICPFRQMRDTRTIFDAYEERFGNSPYPAIPRVRWHHPLEDAYMQAVAVQVALKGLTNG